MNALLNALRIVADWQFMSEEDVRTWMEARLGEAHRAGHILGWKITGAYPPGPWGIQFVTFEVDVTLAKAGDVIPPPRVTVVSGGGRKVYPKHFHADMTPVEAARAAGDLLNGIVDDTDVAVRWIHPFTLTDPN